MKQPFKALSFVILAQFTSCAILFPCKEIKPLLTLADETRKWMPYALGDHLIFESDLSQDTLEVTFYSESIGEYIWGDECPSGEMETIGAKLTSKLLMDSISFKIQLENYVLLENNELFLEFRDDDKYIIRGGPDKTYHSTFILNQKTYSDVIVSLCDSCDNLKEIVFAKDAGLIAFRNKVGYWIRK